MYPEATLSGTDLTVTVDEQVGSGTHWRTFRARTESGDPVAVRTLQGTIPPDAYDRFESLAAQWHTVSSEDTVRTLLDWGIDPNPWVAVDYAPGELESYVAGTPIEAAADCDLATRAELLRDVCDAIRSYGRYGSTRTHLAIGPESVSFRDGPDGPTAVVGDWGISRLVDDPPVTPYTAPEQVAVAERDDAGHAGQATDVYRIGALGVRLFSGSPPFPNDGSSLADRIRRGIDEEVGFTDVAEEFIPALRRATARDPVDRHEGVYQLGRDVSAAAPRVSPGERSVGALSSPGTEPRVEGPDPGVDADADAIDSDGPAGDDSDGDAVDAEPETGDESAVEPDDEAIGDRNADVDAEATNPTAAGQESNGAEVAKAVVVVGLGLIALIVLVASIWSAMASGPIGGGGGDTVQGTVYADAEGIEPVAGAEVTLEGLSGPSFVVTTDANGAFTIGDVSDDEYVLTVDGFDHVEYDERDLEVPSDDTGDLEIRPDRALISGEVVDAETGEPISTEGDGEVDANVELVDTSREDENVDAATGGSYEFAVEEFDGEYAINADADGYESGTLDIERFGEQDDLELEQVTMSLSGQVTDSREGEGGIEAATVTVTTDAGQEFTATTDGDGAYETDEDIPIGDHDIEVDADGFDSEGDTVEFEEENVEANFELDAEASVEGTLRQEGDDESVINFARVTIYENGYSVGQLRSDSSGRYGFDGLSPGEYTVLVDDRTGFADEELVIVLEAGETLERDIELALAE
ncbi:hypothetical protein J2751_002857 [Halorubrum alkaliphilum]|uniref:Protein kinase domain-containing protein n=1 Tax=Halorubrum alkaliphilum TaxID=261290 RepID=A0A8T4GLD8_9EURY|nr:carboxypeptidase regulatory-like domain-containing protein [Halorubrum alkaliphilum]MBP1923812.1 hypothetical protein [Halorubrum alkaliphilum]